MKWILRFFIGSLFSTLVVTPYVCNKFAQEKLAILSHHEDSVRAVLPKFIADLKLLETDRPFRTRSRFKNAEPLLSQWVSLEGRDFKPLITPANQALAELIKKYPKATRERAQFNALAADPLLAKINTNWMEKLSDFDHWSVTAHPQIQKLIATTKTMNNLARIGAFANLPLPDFTEFRNWGLVHVAKSYNRGRTADGLLTYRKLADLVNSTDTLVGAMVAVAMLKTEPNLAEFTGEKNWALVPAATILAYQRASWGWAGILKTTYIGEFPKEVEAFMKPELGMCGGGGESASALIAFSDFFEPSFPFELDLSEPLARARNIQAKVDAACDLKDMGFVADRSPASANPLLNYDLHGIDGSDMSGKWLLPNPARIPYVRRGVAMVIITIAMPNFMKFYTEEAH